MLTYVRLINILNKTYARRFCTRSQDGGKKTCLHDFHVAKGGKMVSFANHLMPVQYSDLSINESHLHTRKHVGIFDVSHMVQTRLHGPDRIKFMESLVVSDIQGLKEDTGCLSLFTTHSGGIIDDLIVSKTSKGYLYVVTNAGCAEKDLNHLKINLEKFKSSGGNVDLEILNDKALIAIQGPSMSKVLQPLVKCSLDDLTFMSSVETSLCGIEGCRVTRCGYTGGDGVEVSLPEGKAVEVVEILLNSKVDDVRLAGLGARDSLRLEAGLCLYGNDIDETTTPIEASLGWTIGKRRKNEMDFPGADVIMKQIKNKPLRRRVGFFSRGPPARGNTKILDANTGENIGKLTSGCPSPCLNQNISMGYVKSSHVKSGTDVALEIRKKTVPAKVTKMPFVPAQYYVNK